MANLIAEEIERNQNKMQRKPKIFQKRCEGKNRLVTESRDVERGEGKRRKKTLVGEELRKKIWVRFGRMKVLKGFWSFR